VSQIDEFEHKNHPLEDINDAIEEQSKSIGKAIGKASQWPTNFALESSEKVESIHFQRTI